MRCYWSTIYVEDWLFECWSYGHTSPVCTRSSVDFHVSATFHTLPVRIYIDCFWLGSTCLTVYSTRRCVRVNGGSLAVLFHVLDGRTALASGSFVFRLRYVSVRASLFVHPPVCTNLHRELDSLATFTGLFRVLEFQCSQRRWVVVLASRCSLLRFLRDRPLPYESTSNAFGLCLTLFLRV